MTTMPTQPTEPSVQNQQAHKKRHKEQWNNNGKVMKNFADFEKENKCNSQSKCNFIAYKKMGDKDKHYVWKHESGEWVNERYIFI